MSSATFPVDLPQSAHEHHSGDSKAIDTSTSTEMTIWCTVLGEFESFAVRMTPDQFVYDLKKKIQNESHATLSFANARHLTLYKINIRDDDALPGIVKEMRLDAEQVLKSRQLISEIFPAAPEAEKVHILVQPPERGPVSLAMARDGSGSSSGASGSKDRHNDMEIVAGRTKRDFEDFESGHTVEQKSGKRRRVNLLAGSTTVYMTEGGPTESIALPTRAGGFAQLKKTPKIIAADKTQYIELLDKNYKYEYLFLRPRRWGKTTFLAMLADYYDKSKLHLFDDLFHGLYIGKKPTSSRNTLLVLKFDFSTMMTLSSIDRLETQFNDYMFLTLKTFLDINKQFLNTISPTTLDRANGVMSLQSVLQLVKESGHHLFVGVDEYDAPANSALFNPDQEHFNRIAHLFKTQFFAVIKQATADDIILKYWITGVLPVFRDGISPLAATEILSNNPQYHGICGLTDSEVKTIAQAYLSPGFDAQAIENAMETLRGWYNGYLFSHTTTRLDSLYNPQLVFTHLKALASGQIDLQPQDEIEAPHISNVLNAIPDVGTDSFASMFLQVVSGTLSGSIQQEFGINEVRQIGSNAQITRSLLYFYGVFNYEEGGEFLKVPNETMRRAIGTRMKNYLEANKKMLSGHVDAAHGGLIEGNVQPLVTLLETFFELETARVANDMRESTLRAVLEVFWFTNKLPCFAELHLIMDPSAKYGDGRHGFVDIFIPSPSISPCLELKNIPLLELWRGETTGGMNSDAALQHLREKLRNETEDQLLERKFKLYDDGRVYVKQVKDIKADAFRQITGYLDVIKQGNAVFGGKGVVDHRVQRKSGTQSLVGYVVICLGGTRVLAWQVKVEEARCSFVPAVAYRIRK